MTDAADSYRQRRPCDGERLKMTISTVDGDEDVIVRREGAAGIIRLNRPKTINALTLEMVVAIDAALDRFEADSSVAVVLLEGAGERGLCAGGDIRGLYESSRVAGLLGKVFWRREYTLNARIAKYSKPYVAFMEGLVMGGGVGLSAHGRHRIVTERTKLAMPEVGLGFFPDVGGTWLLSRAPGEIGTYFALTGQTMNGPDAIHARFADAVVPSGKLGELREVLTRVRTGATSQEVAELIGSYATGVKAGPVAQIQEQIDRWFAFDHIEEIVSALQGDGSELAASTLKTLADKSPRGMVVTLKLLRLARRSMSLEECLVREYRAALEVFRSEEFREGVRAAIIDKDRNPKWSPSSIETVTPEIIAPYFAEIGADELVFGHQSAIGKGK
jgi:enoyl-CoA hydratase